MKKYKLLASILLASLSLNSCYDLDRYPSDQVSDGIFWKSETHAKQGMMGVYAAMQVDDAFGLKFTFDSMSDIGTGFGNEAYSDVITGIYNERSSFVEKKWQSLFDGVMRANLVIRKIAEIESMSESQKEQYVAEAKFMRALFYFELYNFYGALPLYDESVNLSTDYNNMKKPRSTEADVLKFILDDLDFAITHNLPVHWDVSEYGRATLGAAYALRGKVYLYMKEYTKAVADFEEIILDKSGKGYNYSLYEDYSKLFTPEGDESNEMIFAIQNSGGVGKDYGMPIAFYMGNRATYGSDWASALPSTKLVDMYEYQDGRPFDWEEIIPGFTTSIEVKDKTYVCTLTKGGKAIEAYPENRDKLLAMYKQRDPRMMQTIIMPYTTYDGWVNEAPKTCEFVISRNETPNEVNGFIRVGTNRRESYIFRKFVPVGNMNGEINNREDTPINFPLIRLADVYLMYAECKNELDDQTTAVEYINKVRQRPSTNMPAINSGATWLKATTKSEVFERIKHERAVELIAEGHRWFDLRRWNIAKDVLPGDVYGATGQRMMTRTFLDRDMLWPIPGVEIERNPALEPNNPGWD